MWLSHGSGLILILWITLQVHGVTSQDPSVYTLCDFATESILMSQPDSTPVIIRSPSANFNSLDCSVVLLSTHQPLLVSFNYSRFQIEYSSFCERNSLCVNGVLFCGQWLAGRILENILPEYSSLTVRFKANNNAIIQTDFEVSITYRLADSQPVYQAAGTGSSPATTYFTYNVYAPGMNYRDKCAEPQLSSIFPPRSEAATTAQTTAQTSTVQTTAQTAGAKTIIQTATAQTTVQTAGAQTTAQTATAQTTVQTTGAQTTAQTATSRTTTTDTIRPEGYANETNVYTLCDATQSVVNINANSPPVLIQSPNYTVGNYDNFQRCSIDVVSGPEPLILSLYYSFFQVESNTYCGYDALCVNGVKFCGIWLQGRTFDYILPPYRTLTVTFTTDGSVTYRGFEILLTSEVARSQIIRQVSSGVGFSESNVNYTSVSYYPGYPYTNRCPAVSTNTLQTSSTQTTSAPPSTEENVYTLCDATRSVVNINANSTPVLIRSPNYAVGNYDNNQRCSIDVVSGPEPLILSLYYSFFQVESNNYCNFDAVCVNGVQFCGNWLQGRIFNYILPAYRTFTITFNTDHSVTYRGFEILMTSEFARGQIIQVSSGVGFSESNVNYTFESYYPGYPYTNRCPAASANTLQTSSTQTISAPPPTFWWGLPVYTFCDYSRPNVVDIDGRSRGILIRSPNYATSGYYQDNQRCSISLRSVGEPLILTLRYNYFQLESHSLCQYDWLCANGVPYCGEWLVGRTFQYIIPAYNFFTLNFRTDGSRVYRGFEIQVSPERIVNQTIREAIGGYGSDNNSVSYRNVTYGPDFSYTDRCTSPVNPSTYYPSQSTPTPLTGNTTGSACQTAGPSYNVMEIEAAIDNAIELLNRAKVLLVGRN